ncbi:MAG TPA: hypothetical protein VH088_12405 [Terriglobales bacterium]|jgi:hypothetical protein|nr:hypothetical protein [Terriglobales bacterium]
MSKYRLAQVSAVLNLLGALLVFFSFQATSNDFILVSTPDGEAAFCVGGKAMFGTFNKGLLINTDCPKGKNFKPTAVVVNDSPYLGYLGWGLLGLGFILQFFSIEKPTMSAEQLRTLRKAQKILDAAK